ncbi:MAG TPA: choice-of-anchor P family protein [Thermoanaerobaculia bacterium]|nr:choice-of-anchor P family protein [Thermoanaerobaculia bacterium]
MRTSLSSPPSRAAAAIAGILLLAVTAAAGADTVASSSAFGESVSLQILPLLGSPIHVNSGPLPAVTGTNPASHAQLASISVSAPALGTLLQTGILQVNAAALFPGTELVSGDAVVNTLQLRVAGGLPLLTLNADTLHSTAQIAGGCNDGAVTTGSANLTNVVLGGPLGLGLQVAANPPPNTVLLNVAGIRVVLNEQIPLTGSFPFGIAVNALHISLTSVPLGLSLLSGDIILAHAEAELQCTGGDGGGGGPTQ